MKILILSSAFSGLTQRVYRELTLLGHRLEQHYDLEVGLLRQQLKAFDPDVVVCPFLTQRIPKDVWKKYRCLIVHPGIEGDRGPSSLDWAISAGKNEWGVTLVQADAEMDAGDIWGTQNFPMREGGKTSLYKREVSSTAIALIKQAIINCKQTDWKPRSLDENSPHAKGQLMPVMKQTNRAIDWQTEKTSDIVCKLNAADTNPGILDSINGIDVYLYGAIREPELTGEPGKIIAIHKGAICRATSDGAVWIRQLKCKCINGLAPIKLPASSVVKELMPTNELKAITKKTNCATANDIWVERKGSVAYLYFNFYNGAMNTQQCLDLKCQLNIIKGSDVKVIVFMGGEDFWSNGIHLNCIEAATDPAQESWQNINAIDDVVLEMINSTRQITVAALRNNAGAGGAMMALACDHVVIRDGVVLNPHYGTMGLYGSEYWTYLLPRRVGEQQARLITAACEPMLASEAKQLGMADKLLPEDWQQYHRHLFSFCSELSEQGNLKEILRQKKQNRRIDQDRRPLINYRREELTLMKEIFYRPDSDYHRLRREFVCKEKRSARAMQTLANRDQYKEAANT